MAKVMDTIPKMTLSKEYIHPCHLHIVRYENPESLCRHSERIRAAAQINDSGKCMVQDGIRLERSHVQPLNKMQGHKGGMS